MSDQTGGDTTQNSQDTAYKTFANEDEFKQFESKTFSNGYNDFKSKTFSRVGELLGSDVSSLDDVESHIKELQAKVNDGIKDPTATDEYRSLQSKLQEATSQIDQLTQQNNQIRTQYDVDKAVNNGLMSVKESNKLNIPEADVRDLFKTRYKTDQVDGRLVAKRYDDTVGDYKAVTDENGNYKPLDKVFADFAKSYATPKAQGSGGESGSGAGTAKVKRSELQQAIKSNDQDKAQRLFEAGQKNGWIEDLTS